LIERTCRHAQRFAEGLRAAGYQILNDVVINQVLVSFGEPVVTRAVIAKVQADGTCWCGGTEWHGRPAMRISVSSWATTEEDVEMSLAAIRRIAEEVHEPASRTSVLDGYVEIALATGDVAGAHAAAEELMSIAGQFDATFVYGISNRALGAVLMAEHDAKAALTVLRRCLAIWSELDAPYEAARARVLIALACDEMDDNDAATMELKLAREVFQRLAASPDCAKVELLLQKRATRNQSPLSMRELDVLLLIAAGKSNKAIAVKLGISEKTVARHVSNIFNKLDLSSRAAAAAYAYQHQLISST